MEKPLLAQRPLKIFIWGVLFFVGAVFATAPVLRELYHANHNFVGFAAQFTYREFFEPPLILLVKALTEGSYFCISFGLNYGFLLWLSDQRFIINLNDLGRRVYIRLVPLFCCTLLFQTWVFFQYEKIPISLLGILGLLLLPFFTLLALIFIAIAFLKSIFTR